jgi:hypothetical protein
LFGDQTQQQLVCDTQMLTERHHFFGMVEETAIGYVYH